MSQPRLLDSLRSRLLPAWHRAARPSEASSSATKPEDLQRCLDEARAAARTAELRALGSQHAEALGRMSGALAHDFNNLLGVINSSAHLIARLSSDSRVAILIASILRSVETSSRRTQDVLRLAQRSAAAPQRVDLQHFLPHKQELLEAVLGQQIALKLVVEADTTPIEVDAHELELALINLALNAREAITGRPRTGAIGSKLGEVQLVARPASDLAPEDSGNAPRMLICMADDGRGLDETLIPRVFEPFFTTQPIGASSGLGLSQVHTCCLRAGGEVHLRSTLGLGTVVSMLLPAALPRRANSPAHLPADIEGLGSVDGGFLRGLNVLVIDDNEIQGSLTTALLTRFGGHANWVRDARQALEAFEPGKPPVDLLLGEVIMAGNLDGIAMARQLRRRFPSLRVVLTGEPLKRRSGDDFVLLPTPSSPGELLAALREARNGG